MENVRELIKEIDSTRTQHSASQKDEVRVMRAMLNDKDYVVDVYGKDGKEGELCPAKEAREMIASVITSATKISQEEAAVLADKHEFKKSEAGNMVQISKEFVNTYIETGRKLPLGKRAKSNVSLLKKEIDGSSTKTYPKKVGVDENGKDIYNHVPVEVVPHTSMRVISTTPEWIKK